MSSFNLVLCHFILLSRSKYTTRVALEDKPCRLDLLSPYLKSIKKSSTYKKVNEPALSGELSEETFFEKFVLSFIWAISGELTLKYKIKRKIIRNVMFAYMKYDGP